MANCINCGAAIAAKSIVCKYCNTRQDVDLKGIHQYTVEKPEAERTCPRCNKPMQTIDLKIGDKFLIERCSDCLGMFFDPGELEALLDKSVANVYHIDYSQLETLKIAKRHDDFPVTYIKCPVCQKLMNRINFGSQSGVIIDKCRQDGVWLDGGELRQLMEWTKAGGQIHHQQTLAETQKIQLQQEKEQKRQDAPNAFSSSQGYGGLSDPGYHQHSFDRNDDDLVSLVIRFVSKLFR
jgi:Zn-finger nucleic acid-binding protein